MAVALDDPRHRPPCSSPSARGRLAAVPDRAPVRAQRMYRRRRLLVLAAALLVLSVTFAALNAAQRATASDARADVRVDAPVSPALHAAGTAPGPADRVVVLAAGESVWEAVAPHVPEGMSVHDWVDRVVRHNAVDPAVVPAGTLLRLPSQ